MASRHRRTTGSSASFLLGTEPLTPMVSKATFGWTDVCPAFTNAVLSGKIEAYNLPMGQISHMIRCSANGQPGAIS